MLPEPISCEHMPGWVAIYHSRWMYGIESRKTQTVAKAKRQTAGKSRAGSHRLSHSPCILSSLWVKAPYCPWTRERKNINVEFTAKNSGEQGSRETRPVYFLLDFTQIILGIYMRDLCLKHTVIPAWQIHVRRLGGRAVCEGRIGIV